MAGKSRFSETLLKMINMPNVDGETMIALSRAILRNSYTETEFEADFFSIFILIDDESGDIVLSGFGEFNLASKRANLTESHVTNTINIIKSSSDIVDRHPNAKIYYEDILEIERLYAEQFRSSVQAFKLYFDI